MTGIRVKLHDPMKARGSGRRLAAHPARWPRRIRLDDAEPEFSKCVQMEKRGDAFIILTLIVAVAAFNLVSTLVMVVTDKGRTSILRTSGRGRAA